jgi:geranylgeranyl diphosphate synthase type I
MREELKRYQKLVDKEIERFSEQITNNSLSKDYNKMKQYLLRPGKRIRPIACIKSYEAFTAKKDRKILLPAISLELFHVSSLVHDDIMDEDDLRRNKPSMHRLYREGFLSRFKDTIYKGKIFNKDSVRYSTSSAIIQGNILFSLGLKSIVDCKFNEKLKNEALNIIQDAYRKVNEGQLLDVLNEFKPVTEKDYIKMASLKTGVLLATSFELGAIFADTSNRNRKLISYFGMNVAIAFQIHDDIMDISKNMKKGNTLGSDIMKGKMTLLLINALKNSSKKQKEYLKKIVGNTKATKAEIMKAVKIFKNTGSVKRAKLLAERYVNKGKGCLKKLKKEITPESYKFFIELADFMVKRNV